MSLFVPEHVVQFLIKPKILLGQSNTLNTLNSWTCMKNQWHDYFYDNIPGTRIESKANENTVSVICDSTLNFKTCMQVSLWSSTEFICMLLRNYFNKFCFLILSCLKLYVDYIRDIDTSMYFMMKETIKLEEIISLRKCSKCLSVSRWNVINYKDKQINPQVHLPFMLLNLGSRFCYTSPINLDTQRVAKQGSARNLHLSKISSARLRNV